MVMSFNQPYYPMMTAQQKVMQYEQGFRVLPVTNKEEANATQVDIQGTPTFFFNSAKNEIYMKRVNLQTGMADFFIFQRLESPTNEVNVSDSINYQKETFEAIMDKLDSLQEMLREKKNAK